MKRILSVVVAAVCMASSALATTDVASPQGLLKGQLPDNAVLKRVAITTFYVQYVTDQGIETKRSRGGTFFSKWKGVTPDVMLDTSNALYARLVEELKAAGIEVVASEQVAAQAAMADLRKVAKPNPTRIDDSTLKKISLFVAAQDLPITFATLPDAKLSSYATQPVEGTDPPGNLVGWDKQSSQWLSGSNVELGSLATIYFGQAKLAENLNATALNVRLVVPLVDLGVTTAGNAGGGIFGSAKVTGVIKPNPRFVEAGTVFSFAHAGGNPGHRFVLGLQKPVAIGGLKVTADPEKVSLDETVFGKQSARGQGLLGALTRATGVTSDDADFWVSVDSESFQPALVAAGGTIFKELAQVLSTQK